MLIKFAKLLCNGYLSQSLARNLNNQAKSISTYGKLLFKSKEGAPNLTKSTFERPQELLTLQLKRKPVRLKPIENKFKSPGVYSITAYPTSEEINLEGLLPMMQKKLLYKAEHIQESLDVIRATNELKLGCEPQEIYVFREGAVVLWNVPQVRVPYLLQEIRNFEQHRYAEHVVTGDAEHIGYTYNYRNEDNVGISDKQEIMLSPKDPRWEKYVASHVLAASVKLSVWERQLEKYIRNIEFITEDLKYGRKIKMSQEQVLRKHGALFALRHVINLSSSLLDPPQMLNYTKHYDNIHRDLNNFYGMNKRLRILRDKMNHCLELIMLLSTHLRDKHRLRLEWLVIGLILVELAFEAFYCFDRLVN